MKNKRITILIKNLSLEFDKIANPRLAPYDLTLTQFKILKYLYDYDNVIGKDIEKAYSMTNPTVTGVIENMEKHDWIKRVPNPNDARSKIIKLTDKAFRKKEELHKLGDDLEKSFTKDLTITEQKELFTLLNKMMEGMNK